MAVRIKTIPNHIVGAKRTEQGGAHSHVRASDATGQANKILELEWEALGRKLNKHSGNGAEVEKLRRQLKEKDEMLMRANQKIATLKKELGLLQQKQRAHRAQPVNHNNFKAPARMRK